MAGTQPIQVQEIQAGWLKVWHRYMVTTYAPECIDAFEVGCGSGFVMRNLEEQLRVKGIDINMEQVSHARDIGMEVEFGDGSKIDLPDSSFDLVYCSFFLMWIDDPGKVIEEMIRIGRQKVMILSEPVWSRTVFSPSDLGDLVNEEIISIKEQGGNPDFGLSLIKILKERSLEYRFGTIPMDTSSEETRKWVEVEFEYLTGQGRKIDRVEPEIFHVPFIWAVIDLL